MKKTGGDNPWAGIGNIEDETPLIVDYSPVVVDNEIPVGTIVFDLETGSVVDMWSTGPEFIRLSGHSIDNGECFNSPSVFNLMEDIMDHEGWIVTHNGNNFDSILLDRLHGVSILALAKAERLRDTKLIAFLADPPFSRTKEGEIEKIYSLESVGAKYLGEGKMKDAVTGKSVLKRLAEEFGGYDKIPVDHPEYNEYLKRDVEVTRDLVKVLPMNDYVLREHKIAAVAATISIQGFRVDVPLLDERIKQGEAKRHTILTNLQSYGLPSPEETKAPQMTKVGKAAIATAFSSLGVTMSLTPGGSPALGKDILLEMIENTDNQEVIDLAEAIMGLNGIRTIYGNIQEHLVNDRVHPSINLRQSTGRWSIQKPGLTVIGKRGGKVIERAVFLPDQEDHILISADLAQVDARAVAALSQDTEYLKLFEEGRDLHAEMALRLFGTEDERERAKAAAHGINYGMRGKKLALTTGMTLFEAENVINNFENNFRRLTRWQNEQREIGESTGILYNGFGRMMRIEPERAFTQSPALMGQSTARDLLMEGILRLWNMGGETVIRMIRAVVHDELVLSVHKNDVEEIEHLVVAAMSFPWRPASAEFEVQITAGLNKRGKDWADCYRK
jgi:DNA polymerase-1